MGCGCKKNAQRRSGPTKIIGARQNTSSINLSTNTNNNTVSAQSMNRGNSLNQGGVSAEKRRVQALRRNEILKKLGKI
jgi:hypothetical protein